MRAHYGYKDASGDYFITVNTEPCAECSDHPCVTACPAGVLEITEDDYGDEACAVSEAHRKRIKYSCAPCKPDTAAPALPCTGACPADALSHSW
jgi:Fe-S-cluster-containing hydrogenase component 2